MLYQQPWILFFSHVNQSTPKQAPTTSSFDYISESVSSFLVSNLRLICFASLWCLCTVYTVLETCFVDFSLFLALNLFSFSLSHVPCFRTSRNPMLFPFCVNSFFACNYCFNMQYVCILHLIIRRHNVVVCAHSGIVLTPKWKHYQQHFLHSGAAIQHCIFIEWALQVRKLNCLAHVASLCNYKCLVTVLTQTHANNVFASRLHYGGCIWDESKLLSKQFSFDYFCFKGCQMKHNVLK